VDDERDQHDQRHRQGDEGAVRLGQPTLTSLTGTTVGGYPGGVSDVPSRESTCTSMPPDFCGCDGHLVTVSITEVPLPPTLSMVGFGLVAISIASGGALVALILTAPRLSRAE
jgi:hypothetical protein